MQRGETHSTCPDCQGINLLRRKTCPTCGRSLDGTPFELPELPDWMDYRLARWLRGKTPRDIALRASLIPIFLPFPIIAILLMAATFYRNREVDMIKRWLPILVLSLVNIALSIFLLHYLSNGLWNVLFDWWARSPGLLPVPQHPGAQTISL